MAILNYKDLKLTKNNLIRTFKWGTQTVEVLGYLPIEAKYDVVMITLQKSFEDGIYNPIKLDMFYHLNLIYALTNLVFAEEDREDEAKLYDELVDSGFMVEFLKYVNPDVYEEMQEDIDNIAELNMKYKNSAASLINKLIDDLPANAEAAQKIVDNFDKDKYQAVVDFAQAANGGRKID